MNNLHIHAPLPSEKKLHRVKCLDCKKRTFFVSFYYEWYGTYSTCLKCGRRYNNGKWEPLDLEKHARKKNINNSKKYYRSNT